MGHREDSQVPWDGCDIQGAGCHRLGNPCAPKQEDPEALSPGWGWGLAANCTAHCPQHIIDIPEGKGRELISCRLPPPMSYTSPAYAIPSQVQMRVCVLQEDKWSQLGRCFRGPHIPFLHPLIPSIPVRPCAQILGSVACGGCLGDSC